MRQPGPSRSRRRWLTALRVPGLTFGILLIPFTIYYVHVRYRREYLTSRNFRLLATMSEQIKERVDNLASLIHSAALEARAVREGKRSNRGETTLWFRTRQFLEKHQLECVANCDLPAPEKPYSIAFERDGEQVYLHLRDKSAKMEYRRSLESIIRPLLPTDGDRVFEDLLVADQHDGRVLYQQSRAKLRFNNVNIFLPKEKSEEESSEQQSGAALARAGSPRHHEREPVHLPSKLIETNISGTRYKAFVQPIQLSLPRQEGGRRLDPRTNPDAYTEWLLFGLVRSDSFFSECLLVSYSMIEFVAVVLLLAFLSWPLLKLRYMTPRERFSLADGLFLGMSIIVGAAVMTLVVLNGYYSWGLEKEADQQLKQLAQGIRTDLRRELYRMRYQLEFLGGSVRTPRAQSHGQSRSGEEPTWVGQVRLGPPREVTYYPPYDLAFWTDKFGRQMMKWTPDKTYTLFVDVRDRPAYQLFSRGERWFLDRNDPPEAGFLLISALSPTTGKNQATFVMENPNRHSNGSFPYAYLVSQPRSLFKTVLPEGFGFSLINRRGWALFHSNDLRNQRENLLEECDNDRAVLSAAFGGDPGRETAPITTNYMGREHRLYFPPIDRLTNVPWSLVTFRDRTVTRTVSLEVLTIAAELFLLYVALLMVACAVIYVCFGRQQLLVWVWPSASQVPVYRNLHVVYSLWIVFYLAWIVLHRSDLNELVLGACALSLSAPIAFVAAFRTELTREGRFTPMLALVPGATVAAVADGGRVFLLDASFWSLCWIVVGLTLTNSRVRHSVEQRICGHAWRGSYTRVACGLVMLVGVLPAVSFWQAARHFETTLFIQWGQRKLAAAMDQRELSALQGVGAHQNRFYDTQTEFAPSDEQAPAHSFASRLLSHLTIPYNQTALEIRGLAPPQLQREGRVHFSRSAFDQKHTPYDLLLKTRVPGLDRPNEAGDWLILTGALAGLGLVLTVVFLLVRNAAAQMFLLDLAAPGTAGKRDLPELDSVTRPVLLIGPAGSGKSGRLRERALAQPIDLAAMTDAGKAIEEIRLLPPATPVALDHFEHRMDDRLFREQKLRLLEDLVFLENRRVVLVSSVDPLYYLSANGGVGRAGEADARWAGVLCCFDRHYVQPQPPAFLREQELPPEGLGQAETYYRAVWARCTSEEKLLLVHLAQGSLVHPKNEPALRQLLWKGLVARDPFRIVNESLRNFVLATARASEIQRWEREAGKGWAGMRTSFATILTGLALLFFVGQREILQTWIPYVSGVAGSLAGILKAFESVRGGPEQTAE